MSGSTGKRDLLELGKGTAASALIQGLGALFLYLYHVILARFLGPRDYGLFSFSFSIMTFVTVISQMGLQTGALRFAASSIASGDLGKFKGILIRSHQITVLSSLVFLGLSYAILRGFGGRIPAETSGALIVFIWLIPVSGLLRVRQYLLRGLKKITLALVPENIILPLAAVACTTLLFAFGLLDLSGAIIAYLAANGISLAVGWYFLSASLEPAIRAVSPSYNTRELLAVSLPMMFTSIWQLILTRIDQIMLGLLRPMSEVGVYSAASRTAMIVLFIITSVNVTLAPMISSLHHLGERERLQEVVRHALRWVFLLTFPCVLFVLLAGRPILALFGGDFVAGYPALVVLVVAQFFSAYFGCVGLILTMTGRQNIYGLIILVTSLVNILLNYVLIPRFGIVGSAVANLLSIMLWNIWMTVDIWCNMNLKAFVIPPLSHFLIGIVPAAVAFILLRTVNFAMAAVGFLCVLVFMLYRRGICNEDRQMISAIMSFRKGNDLAKPA